MPCVRKGSNTKDPYAVAVTCESAVVGHTMRKLSTACQLFFTNAGDHHLHMQQ